MYYIYITAEVFKKRKQKNGSLEIWPEVQDWGKPSAPRRSLNITSGVCRVNFPGKKERMAVRLAAYATSEDRGRQPASKQATARHGEQTSEAKNASNAWR